MKWDIRFLRLAREIASWSKDPSTKVGAVIVDENNRVVSLGYNGFPRGLNDSPELYADRNEKYKRVLHAEQNAFIFAEKKDLRHCTLYTFPLAPCPSCALLAVQHGIKRVVCPEIRVNDPHRKERVETWLETYGILTEAGIEAEFYSFHEILTHGILAPER